MASGLFSSIQSLSTNLLHAIRGFPSTSQDLASPVADQNKSVREDLEKLSRMLERIQAVQQDAEEREIHDRSVQLWLKELRGVAYQAEDVLDEFYYEVLKSIVESGDAAIEAYHRDGGTKRKFAEMYTSSLATYSFTINKASILDGMAEKIKDIKERFEEISNARRDLHLREEEGTRLVSSPQIRQPTSDHVDENAIFGRKEEKEKIISLLNPSSGPDFMVLPIVGMGGLGKTTLARLVYHDSRICQLFDKRCWVYVSEDFNLLRLTKAIVDVVTDNPCLSSELSILQDILKKNLRDIGLFLVLDDVWNENRNLWECFRVGFFGAKFVRILMTTRNTSAAKSMQTTSPFQLGSLCEGTCWSLFKHFAFGNRETSENANLHKIGHGIVKKCKGSPLAIKAFGGILRYEMDEEKWMEILESDISDIDDTGEVMPALRLSYQKLPQHVKPCFLYLSMFPKGTPFEKDMVVRLWMAQGYIYGNTKKLKTLEEIGSEYFDELQGRSLVNRGPLIKYVLHDLIHDMARSISHEAYRPVLEDDQQCNGPRKVHHMYLTEQDQLLNSFLAPNNYWSIRTVVKECPTENFDFAILSETACARALHLRYSLLRNTLGILKHLRYLSVGHSQMETLPETLCLLYNLQTLDLNMFYLRELPENIKNLINLQYFQLSSDEIQHLPESIFLLRNLHSLLLRNCTKLKMLPRGIEQVTRLRILDLPVSPIYMPSMIKKLRTLQQLSGHFSVMDHDIIGGLRVLKDMNKLSGLLCISGLRNIGDVACSRNANLASKPNLHKLILNFQEDPISLRCRYKVHHLHLAFYSNAKNVNDEMTQDVVLQSLQPHCNLTQLAILNYGGRIFPSWLVYPLLPKLTTLTLNFCTEPNFIPPFGQLPNLRFLEISVNTSVRNVGDELSTYSLLAEYDSSKQPKEPSYPSLVVLSLRNMPNLVEWQAHDADFPHLKKLVIEDCPKLWKIPTIPKEIREVTFKNCSKLKLLICPSVIKKLMIHQCGFRKIMIGSVYENLTISHCVKLLSINWSVGGLNYIREVCFDYCPKLEFISFPVRILKLRIQLCGFHEIIFQSVPENLTISSCVELVSISWGDVGLDYVEQVSFEHCPKLKLITIPVGTLKLKINYCDVHEIMFRSVFENLTISNCIELSSINWRDESLNPVREVSFENCPKLELVTIPVRILKLRIHECGFREIIFMSISKNLAISECVDLISINWGDVGLNYVEQVSIECCPKLKVPTFPTGIKKLKIAYSGNQEIIFPLQSSIQGFQPHGNLTELAILNYEGQFFLSRLLNPLLPKLTTLTLNFCTEPNFLPPFGQLPYLRFLKISINTGGRYVGDELNTYSLLAEYDSCKQPKEPNYPSLEVLSLINMHNLVEWQAHDGDFPYLKNLVIKDCSKLCKIATNLQEVREVTFEYCPKLEFLTCPSVIRNLKINGCGFREIMFQSVSENLIISNCVNLILINWMDMGLNFVSEISLDYCPKLELLTFPVRILKLRINSCGFREIMFQSVSENLTISNCVNLILINWMDMGLNFVRKISLDYCPKLELLTFPVRIFKLRINSCGFRKIIFQSVPENLTISNCLDLNLINWTDGGLNSLRKVNFEYCPKLELVTIPFRILKLTINTCGFREIIFQSVFENLTISNCIELISINWGDAGLNSIEEVRFERCPKLKVPTFLTGIKKLKIAYCSIQEIIFPLQSNIQSPQPNANLTDLTLINYEGQIFPSWLLNPLLSKLTTLTLDFCTEPNFLPPFGQLPYLRLLKISGSFLVRNVGDELNTYSLLAEHDSSKQPKEPGYPSLEVLSLKNMLNLVEWQAHDGDFPRLKKLVIKDCPKLCKIATILQEVREVTFKSCPKLELLSCPSEITNLKINRCGFREIMFRSVSENLTISNCVDLISINWMDRGLNFVREVSFEYCPKLELTTFPVRILKLRIHACCFREIMFHIVSENLAISNCVELVSINWSNKALDYVREVSFEYCPKLELITIPVRTLKLTIHMCGVREIMFQSVSEDLKISNCIELSSINWRDGGLKYAREVCFEYCPKLELVTIPVRISTLRIHKCGFREIILQSVYENLTIVNCVELISINWKNKGLNSVREVCLEYCPKLELITIPVGALKLKIHECGLRESCSSLYLRT